MIFNENKLPRFPRLLIGMLGLPGLLATQLATPRLNGAWRLTNETGPSC